MRILTFGDYNYIPHMVSSYRNLKLINRHKDITVLGVDQRTVDKIKSIEPECDVRVFETKKYRSLEQYKYDGIVYYCILQYIKQEVMREYVDIYNKVFYLDSDVIIFEDFFDIIDKMLDTHNLALKFYPQADRFNPGKLRNIVNCGTMGVKKSDDADKMYEYFFSKLEDVSPYGNLDEYHMTDFCDTIKTSSVIIDDKINLLNNENKIYSVEEIKQLSPMSFHPTYPITNFYPHRPYSKIGLAKTLGKWYYD